LGQEDVEEAVERKRKETGSVNEKAKWWRKKESRIM
jgi:hypothetical protein